MIHTYIDTKRIVKYVCIDIRTDIHENIHIHTHEYINKGVDSHMNTYKCLYNRWNHNNRWYACDTDE